MSWVREEGGGCGGEGCDYSGLESKVFSQISMIALFSLLDKETVMLIG